MKTSALLLSVIAAALLIVAPHPRESIGSAPTPAQEDSARKIKELQKERIDTLRALLDVSERLYKNGRVEVTEPLEARQLLLLAEVDAAEARADRIKLYESAIAALKDLEILAENRVKAGRAPIADGLKTKARRLELEIALERTKAGK